MVNIFYRTIFTLALFILVSVSTAQAQNNTDLAYVPPVITLLLDDEQCRSVRPATTVTGDQIIRTQADLNQLRGTTKVDGGLFFQTGAVVLDFSPLDSLVEVTGDLSIRGTQITAIDGFDCLQSAGNLLLTNNAVLTNIPDFPELIETGTLDIDFNDPVTRITGFPKLIRIDSLLMDANPQLVDITGFPALAEVAGNMTITSNGQFPTQLTTLSEFASLVSVGGTITINNNRSLGSVSGFDSLSSVGGNIFLINNSALTSITGFTNLSSAGTLFIGSNTALETISGFTDLVSAGSMFVSINPALTSISGFTSLASLGSLEINSNLLLNSIPDFSSLSSINGLFSIRETRLSSISGFPILNSVTGNMFIGSNPIGSITGFNMLEREDVLGTIEINNNGSLDCSNPPPNFLPVNQSVNNLVNCDLPNKTVFLTRTSSKGDLGGVAGADDICQLEADEAGLVGTFLAWISDSDVNNAPINRFTQSQLPYVRPDGEVIADNWDDLVDGNIDIPICVHADAVNLCNSGGTAWTNVSADGTRPQSGQSETCSNFTQDDSQQTAITGVPFGVTFGAWSVDLSQRCDFPARLYCFEQ